MKKGMIIWASVITVYGLSGCSSASEVSTVPKVSQTNGETNPASVETVKGKQQEEESPRAVEEKHSAAYDKLALYMEEECKRAFSDHYVLVEFIISNYEEKTVNGNVEATFGYKVIYKNHEKDPDTVGYIKEAKEKGDPHYQQLYDEYLQTKEMNFEWKAVIDERGSIELYTNVNPKGTRWEKAGMTDFVLHE